MKFSIDREALLDLLQAVTNVVERRQTLPVLSNLLLVVESGRLSLTGTDQEVELRGETSEVSCEQPGEVTVPARKLLDICRSLPERASIAFHLDGNRLVVGSGRFKSHLATLPAEDFPSVVIGQVAVEISLAAKVLIGLLEKTSFAMAQQDVRYFFNGLLIETADGELRFVATNGQRLGTSRYTELEADPGSHQFIVPRKGVSELIRIIPDDDAVTVTLRFSQNHLQVACARVVLTTKLIDATYPDYQRAIPEAGDKVLEGDRTEIKEALGRTAILSNEMYRNVRLLVEAGKLEMHSNNPLQEEAEEAVNAVYDGERLEIGFNVGYLIDALSAMRGSRVRMVFSDANNACLLTDPDDINSRYVISPMIL